MTVLDLAFFAATLPFVAVLFLGMSFDVVKLGRTIVLSLARR